jgi:hypothetical protein
MNLGAAAKFHCDSFETPIRPKPRTGSHSRAIRVKFLIRKTMRKSLSEFFDLKENRDFVGMISFDSDS